MTEATTVVSAQGLAGQAGAAAWLRLVRDLGIVLAMNLVVAVLFATVGGLGRFAETLLECNAVGFAIWGAARALHALTHRRMSAVAVLAVAIPVGFVVGGKLSALLGTTDFVSLIVGDPVGEWRSLAGDLVVAGLATGFFLLYGRAEMLRADLQAERRRAAEALHSETSARLALLQAQIEPHFLFNTLANAQSAIESDPVAAKAILENLNRYLRVSLDRTRGRSATLREELNLLRALLGIAALRLGERLRFTIDVPTELESAMLPPLLVQPLVENALRHGIEPSVSGGEIRIEALAREGRLTLRVIDSGVGLDRTAPEGVGLANVRSRLESLYGERGRIALYRREPCGVVAELSMPLEGV